MQYYINKILNWRNRVTKLKKKRSLDISSMVATKKTNIGLTAMWWPFGRLIDVHVPSSTTTIKRRKAREYKAFIS